MTPGAISGRDDESGGWSGSARVQLADVPHPPSSRAPAPQQGSRDASLKNVGERDDGGDDETTTSRGVGAAGGRMGGRGVRQPRAGCRRLRLRHRRRVLAVATERRTGSEAVGTLALAVEMFARASRRCRRRGERTREAGARSSRTRVASACRVPRRLRLYLDSHVPYFLGIVRRRRQLRRAAAAARRRRPSRPRTDRGR